MRYSSTAVEFPKKSNIVKQIPMQTTSKTISPIKKIIKLNNSGIEHLYPLSPSPPPRGRLPPPLPGGGHSSHDQPRHLRDPYPLPRRPEGGCPLPCPEGATPAMRPDHGQASWLEWPKAVSTTGNAPGGALCLLAAPGGHSLLG